MQSSFNTNSEVSRVLTISTLYNLQYKVSFETQSKTYILYVFDSLSLKTKQDKK